ncbi:GatB/YqeY domain-containing protein [Carnobacteriaceae bacterium zg-84]|uniref:GatB/YqeY domain-containing protein n=1 Tax=Granulicatella sp. zg-84 TaxID=2678503 RepID=UPI0013BEB5BE|nr:GatB/YqeY domain-containing protein [Granulicatella sp. zg-84]NEW66421.1 GatB/YqeY domain-containing protein [Granulicatella sp. zg-84]QMI86112.1 GatB/YqeY domain-containing protein [Carnobacteriaceae bacterium zg-84]
MTLMEQLNTDMKEAMKAKDKERLSVIRMLKASVQKEQIEVGRDLTDDEALTILSRELKQRKDSIREFEKAGRTDLAEKTQFEVGVVEQYMPEQLSEDEVKEVLKAIIQEVGATSASDFGKVMGKAMATLKGQADGNIVNKLVKELLQ